MHFVDLVLLLLVFSSRRSRAFDFATDHVPDQFLLAPDEQCVRVACRAPRFPRRAGTRKAIQIQLALEGGVLGLRKETDSIRIDGSLVSVGNARPANVSSSGDLPRHDVLDESRRVVDCKGLPRLVPRNDICQLSVVLDVIQHVMHSPGKGTSDTSSVQFHKTNRER